MREQLEAEGNGQICSCGKHEGMGNTSPGNIAARYARMRDKMPSFLSPIRAAYLASWEKAHGPAIYDMVQVGVSQGEFSKDCKGMPIKAPIMREKNQQNFWYSE